MNQNATSNELITQPDIAVWKPIVAEYQQPSIWRSLWQVGNTFIPYALTWYLMYRAAQISWWLVIPLAVLAAGLLVRIFVIFHDCGHGSFFKSKTCNHLLGFVSGILTFTPFSHWRWEHSIHHASAGDLDRRGTGDVWTMTVQEFLEASRWRRFAYRLARNPFILFVVSPLYLFLIRQRFPSTTANKREKLSVLWANLGIGAMILLMGAMIGMKAYLLMQLIVIGVAASTGVWLFYVQHQFEGVYWERRDQWDYTAAALQGSSFYKLPKVLQWFTGSIGFHHLHHLSSRIPNYNLERCHKAHPLFQNVKQITLLSSFRSFFFHLWDEQQRKLVGFSHLKQFRRANKSMQRS